jgi:hypothetical protein
MSRVNSKLANGSDAIVPSSYTLSDVILIDNRGQERYITDLCAQISIKESVFATSLQAEVYILDAANMLEKVKPVSGEVLTLIISRRLARGGSEVYNHAFRISEINQLAKLKPGTQTYVINCVSEHAYMSQIKTVSKPFNDVPGALIEKLCIDELIIDPKELSINTETKQTIKGVYPRRRPLFLINWLTRRSYDNGSPFFFYETLGDGIHFNSYENMINKQHHKEYIHTPSMSSTPGAEEYFKGLSNKILKLSTDFNLSKYHDIAAGAYSSTLHTLDIAQKKYKKSTYSYGKDLKLNKSGLLAKDTGNKESGLMFNDRVVEDHSESTNFYVSLNTSAAGGGSNYHAPSEGDILSANAYIENMNGTILTINIYGDFNLSVGMTITCNIMKSVQDGNDKPGKDVYLSGKYLVTTIHHKFGDEYIMQVTCQKDSYIESLYNLGDL